MFSFSLPLIISLCFRHFPSFLSVPQFLPFRILLSSMPVFTGPSFNILLPIISYYLLYTPSSCFSFPLNLFLGHPSICPPYQFNPLITNCFSLGPLYCSIPSPASPIFFPYLSLSSLLPPPLLPFPQHANHNGESTHREPHFYSLFHLNTLHTDCSNPPPTVTES